MKNKLIYIFAIFFINFIFSSSINSKEIFNFDMSEIEITQNGNVIKGFNGGEAFTNDGVSIEAKNFEYNKISTVLIADGNVNLKDLNKNITIYANKITYIKNQEIIIATGNVKLNEIKKDIVITGDEISYYKNQEKFIVNDKAQLIDKKKDINIRTNKITYLKNKKKFFTEGHTKALVFSKYQFLSSDIEYLEDQMKLISLRKTTITDNNFTSYELDSFNFDFRNELLKGTNIKITENINVPISQSDHFFFKDGFFDLKNKDFKTSEAKINLKKDTFDKLDNDPRIYGSSTSRKDGVISVKKAVFTSCKKNDDCPPWKLQASEIRHNQNKKQIIYDNAVLKVYDVPIFYFPKFFHPDPTVKRQSGFLLPTLNNSNVLGSSISIPYFHIISPNKDLTLNPILFSNNVKMMQTEFRQKNEYSSFISDFGFVNGYKSSSTQKKKDIKHFFAKLEKNLNLDNFINSDLSIFFEKVTKDTYLKIFDGNLTENKIKPKNLDILHSGFSFYLENENLLFSGGTDVYEDLTKLESDRYQYVLPYFNLTKNIITTNSGSLNLNSRGNNILDNTNQVKSRVINDFSFKMNDKIFKNLGLKNNVNLFFKNLNSVGKKDTIYKSSPQVELQSLIELNSELPLLKTTKKYNQTLIPRLSLRMNPGDMKDYSDSERKVNMTNIFDLNRLGFEDSLESGNSLTFGVDFTNENKENDDNYLKFKLGTVFRDNIEENIPSQTTLNKKNSNLFGAMEYNMSSLINLGYNFSIDNKIENFEYNSIELGLSLNNFVTKFNYIEEASYLGNTNVFENSTQFDFNKSNSLAFKTRRNREINLTEYYDLVYEYKNDCLTAGIKFNKTYYEDRDLKPSQNLMFTISFYPLTTIEQSTKWNK